MKFGHNEFGLPFLNQQATLLIAVLAVSMLTTTAGPLTQQDVPQLFDGINKLSPKVLQASMFGGSAQARVLVETYARPTQDLANAIRELGGSVLLTFRYTTGLAASLPSSQLLRLAEHKDVKRVYMDDLQALAYEPTGEMRALFELSTVEGESAAAASTQPSNFHNSALSGVTATVLSSTSSGSNTILGIIDTGINSQHAAFTPKNPDGTSTRVIGGRDVSCDGELSSDPFCAPGAGRPPDFTPIPGFDTPTNNFHGTFVAAVAAGSGGVCRPASGLLVLSIEFWTGTTLAEGPPACPSGMKLIPLTGIAPAAELFILKVFDHTGLGVPESFVINAIDEAIFERNMGDNPNVTGDEACPCDIDIINMSLGSATLFDGQDLEDQTVDFATTQGILSVSAAGNDGPASITVSSPGSAQTGIAVAAAADPVQVRIRRDQQLGLGNGYLAYATNDIQVIFFSSRGPTTDGRDKPDIIAPGTFILQAFGEGSKTGLAFGSGTSFSSPAVAGAATLLNSYAEARSLTTSPFDYKEALRGSADPSMVPGWDKSERGTGFLDVEGALAHLQSQSTLGNTETPHFDRSYRLPGDLDRCETDDDNGSNPITLSPGHTKECYLSIPNRSRSIASEIRIRVEVLDLGNNPLVGNPTFGGNAMSLYVQSAKRTTLDLYIDKARVNGTAEAVITDNTTTITGDVMDVASPITSHVIEPGFMRVVVDTDWRSFDRVKFKLFIDIDLDRPGSPMISQRGTILQGDLIVLGPYSLKAGDALVLSWVRDWSRYPTSDLDMYIFDGVTLNVAGATLNSPERVVLTADGSYTIFIDGFLVHQQGATESWTFRVYRPPQLG